MHRRGGAPPKSQNWHQALLPKEASLYHVSTLKRYKYLLIIILCVVAIDHGPTAWQGHFFSFCLYTILSQFDATPKQNQYHFSVIHGHKFHCGDGERWRRRKIRIFCLWIFPLFLISRENNITKRVNPVSYISIESELRFWRQTHYWEYRLTWTSKDMIWPFSCRAQNMWILPSKVHCFLVTC